MKEIVASQTSSGWVALIWGRTGAAGWKVLTCTEPITSLVTSAACRNYFSAVLISTEVWKYHTAVTPANMSRNSDILNLHSPHSMMNQSRLGWWKVQTKDWMHILYPLQTTPAHLVKVTLCIFINYICKVICFGWCEVQKTKEKNQIFS